MDKTQKFAAYFTEDQKDKIDRCQDLDGSRSAAEVVRRAVDFYHDAPDRQHDAANCDII